MTIGRCTLLYIMISSFSNNTKYKSYLGQINYSKAYGHYYFKGSTSGLALKYVVKGQEIYYVNDQLITVPEDHFILVRPETYFEAEPKGRNSETKGICIDMSLVFTKIETNRLLANTILFNEPFGYSKSTFVGQMLDKTASLMQDDFGNVLDHDCLLQIRNNLNVFSENIIKYKEELSTLVKKDSTQKYIIPKLLQAREYIVRYHKERIPLSLLAQHVAMSKFQLLKLFKKCFKCSPHEMQSILRMQSAYTLLQEDKYTLSDIAVGLGYFDLAAFSKKFKAYFGVSPSCLRT